MGRTAKFQLMIAALIAVVTLIWAGWVSLDEIEMMLASFTLLLAVLFVGQWLMEP